MRNRDLVCYWWVYALFVRKLLFDQAFFLHNKGVEIIGAYAKSVSCSKFSRGRNLYQASVTFSRQLAGKFEVKPEYIPASQPDGAFGKISKLLESRYDFSDVDPVNGAGSLACADLVNSQSKRRIRDMWQKAPSVSSMMEFVIRIFLRSFGRCGSVSFTVKDDFWSVSNPFLSGTKWGYGPSPFCAIYWSFSAPKNTIIFERKTVLQSL